MKSYLLKCSIFAVLLFAVLQFAERAVPYYWGNTGFAVKMWHLRHSETRYDTLFLGSSRIYRQLDPQVFDKFTNGKTDSFNLGLGHTSNPEIYYLYDRLLDEDAFSNLKFVIMELQNVSRIARINMGTRATIYSVDFETYLFASHALAELEAKKPKRRAEAIGRYRTSFLQRIFKLNILSDLVAFWWHPAQGDFFLGENLNGFYALDTLVADSLPISKHFRKRRASFLSRPKQIDQRKQESIKIYQDQKTWKYSETHFNRLQDIIERSRSRGIEVLFLLPPRLPSEILEELLPLYEQLDVTNRIDLGDPRAHPEFYELDLSFDVGHLNDKGASLFSQRLALEFMKSVRD